MTERNLPAPDQAEIIERQEITIAKLLDDLLAAQERARTAEQLSTLAQSTADGWKVQTLDAVEWANRAGKWAVWGWAVATLAVITLVTLAGVVMAR